MARRKRIISLIWIAGFSAIASALSAQGGGAAVVQSGGGRGEAFVSPSIFGSIFWGVQGRSVTELIVLWRGQENWLNAGTTRRASGGSSVSRVRMSGSNGITSYSVERDAALGIVIVNQTDTLRFPKDSTFIVMVDRIDRVGGPPVITSVAVPLAERSLTDPTLSRPPLQIVPGQPVESFLVTFLKSHAATREFLTRPSNGVAPPKIDTRDSLPRPPRPMGGAEIGSTVPTDGFHSRYFWELRAADEVTLIVLSKGLPPGTDRNLTEGRAQRRGPPAIEWLPLEYTVGSGIYTVFHLPTHKRIVMNGRDSAKVALDSTAVLMVDHNQRVDGKPAMTLVVTRLITREQIEGPGITRDSAGLTGNIKAPDSVRTRNLIGVLNVIPLVRDFIR